MKLATAQIEAFVRKPDPATRIILLFGPDSGMVRSRADMIAAQIVPGQDDPFRIARLTGAALTEDSALLRDEMAAQALGGGRRLVRVQQAGDGMTSLLADILGAIPDGDTLLLIEAGDLDKRSKLRALAEGESKLIAAIPCYVDDGAGRIKIIEGMLAQEHLKAGREAVQALMNALPPDRMAMQREIEKLSLYIGPAADGNGGGRLVAVDDVTACVTDAANAELDDLAQSVAGGNSEVALRFLDRLFGEQTSGVAIMRALQRHLSRLSTARQYVDQGQSAEAALKKLQPPVFWKYESAMAAQVKRWDAIMLDRGLRELMDAEAALKRTGTPETALVGQTVLALLRRVKSGF